MKKVIIVLSLFTASAFTSVSAISSIAVNAGADGFTGWTEANTGGAAVSGRFLGASGTGMDTSGSSWGLYANSGNTSANIFDFGGSLVDGDSVTISISLGFIDSGGVIGFGLQNSGGVNRFETYYRGGDATDAFKLNDAEGEENITGPDTTFNNSSWNVGSPTFQTITFTQGASDTYSLSFGGVDVTNTNLNLSASDISQIRIFNFNAGSGVGGSNDQFFNSLTAVPEPSTYAALFGLAVFGLAAWKRRRS